MPIDIKSEKASPASHAVGLTSEKPSHQCYFVTLVSEPLQLFVHAVSRLNYFYEA